MEIYNPTIKKIYGMIATIGQVPNPGPSDYPVPEKFIKIWVDKLSDNGKIFAGLKRTEIHHIVVGLLENGYDIEKINDCLEYTKMGSDFTFSLKSAGFDIKKISDNIEEVDNMKLSEYDSFILNPPYNGITKADKPWVKICSDVIVNAKAGAVFGFITPSHFLKKDETLYLALKQIIIKNLKYLEVHHIHKNIFNVGEEVFFWVGIKKENDSVSDLFEIKYFDENGVENLVGFSFFHNDTFSTITWRSIHKKIFDSNKETYKSRGESKTKKQLCTKDVDFVSDVQTSKHIYKWYNTSKEKNIWWTKTPGKNYSDPKIIIDASGIYYKNTKSKTKNNEPIIIDNGSATAGKNVAQFILSDLAITEKHFIWYITHPLIRFAIEKPGIKGAKFLKELYQIPKITSDIDNQEKLCAFFNVAKEEMEQIKDFYERNGEDISAWENFNE